MTIFGRKVGAGRAPRAMRRLLVAAVALAVAVPLGAAIAVPGQQEGAARELTEQEKQVFADSVVPGLDPANTTVTLFDYDNGRTSDRTGDLNSPAGQDASSVYEWWFGGKDGNNINNGHLLTFGTGMNRHMGYWNQGSGSGQGLFAYNNPGFPFMVSSTLSEDGQLSLSERLNPVESVLTGYNGSPKVYQDAKKEGEKPQWGQLGDPIFPNAGAKNIANGVQYLAQHPGEYSNANSVQAGSPPYDSGTLPSEQLGLAYLFDDTEQPGKTTYKNVGGLFQLDGDGYYYYDMRKNYAEFTEKKSGDSAGHFTLYSKPAVTRTDGDEPGCFFPFDKAEDVFEVQSGELVSTAQADNGEKLQSEGGDASGVHNLNHHLGMTVETSFRQPSGGTIGDNGDPMSFQFSGDDDVWVFIDDKLVLDLGGIHSELFGTINFQTGEVLLGPSYATNGIPANPDDHAVRRTTIRRMFEYAQNPDTADDPYQTRSYTYSAADGYRITDATWQGGAADRTDSVTIGGVRFNGETFASDTSHTLKMFYLERGNYDSSLSLRFNLQPELYQEIKKVDQYGNPLAGAEFELYTASPADGSFLTPEQAADYQGELQQGEILSTVTTGDDGVARFTVDGDPLNFADRYNKDTGDGLLYILRETQAPSGYKSLPRDIVLSYDPATSQFKVNNRYQTGAYAGFNVLVTGKPAGIYYGDFTEDGGLVTKPDGAAPISTEEQQGGLVLAVPMLSQEKSSTWQPLYGDNLNGFDAVRYDRSDNYEERRVQIRQVTLEAALNQAKRYVSDGAAQPWYLGWDETTGRIAGTLYDLPGRSTRYLQVNPDGDMRMLYGFMDAEDIAAVTGRSADEIRGLTPEERYRALGQTAQTAGVERMLALCNLGALTPEARHYSTVDIRDFIRNYRSVINIPNEQRQLRVMKVDQNGTPVNGAEFGLFETEDCSGDPVASGITATVEGSDGTLIFDPAGDGTPGHAKMSWPDTPQGTDNDAMTTYYLKETAAPTGYELNETVVPVKVGFYSIYADAGSADDGVTVMAGVGKLTQTMVKYTKGDVNITLQKIIAAGQVKPSGEWSGDWQAMGLPGTDPVQPRTMHLVYGQNALVDYGLSNEDGGQLVRPFFVTDEGYVRASVKQDTAALEADPEAKGINFDNIEGQDITGLFSLLNVVVVTDQNPGLEKTGTLQVSKTLEGDNLSIDDYTKNFSFAFEFFDKDGSPLADDQSYHFIGKDEWGSVKHGDALQLHHGQTIEIRGLPAGTRYKVTETVPDGSGFYTKTPYNAVHEGVIELGDDDEDGTVFSAPFVNAKGAPTLRLVKTDRAASKPLSGVTFELYALDSSGTVDGDALETAATADDGSIAFTYDFSQAGTSRLALREVAPRAGYTKLAADILLEYKDGTLSVANPLECGAQMGDAAGGAPVVKVSNAPARLDVLKVDQAGNRLNGVTFSLYDNPDCAGDPKASTVTGEAGTDGVASFAGIEWPDVSKGPVTWYLKETGAGGLENADSYELNETVVPVVIDTSGVYADAGNADDGVDVLAGPGAVDPAFAAQAEEGKPLAEVTATAQVKSAGSYDVNDWANPDSAQTVSLKHTDDERGPWSVFGPWSCVDEDAAENAIPLLVASEGFLRARVTDADGASLDGAVAPINVVRVTNVRTAPLSVSKTVLPAKDPSELTDAQKTQEFEFNVEVTVPEAWMLPENLDVSVASEGSDAEEASVKVTVDSADAAKGTFSLELSHGQTATVAGLPVGAQVKVTEGECPGYTAESQVLDGTVENDGCTLAFENQVVWPKLSIEKTQSTTGTFTKGPVSVVPGQTITYQLTLTNDGDDTARNVVVTDEVPQVPVEPAGATGPALEYVEGSASVLGTDIAGSYDGGTKTVTWQVGDIPAGDSRVVEFQVTVPAPQVIGTTRWENVGQARYGNNPDGDKPLTSNEVEASITVPVGGLYVSKALVDSDVTEFLSQREFSFTATFTNQGGLLPSKVDTVRVKAAGTEEPGTLSLTGDGRQATSTFSLFPGEALSIAGLAKGTTYRVEEDAQAGFAAATSSFEGEIGSDDAPARVAFENRLTDPGLKIVKTQRLGDDGEFIKDALTAKHGDTVTYRLTVTNNTGAEATDVTVTDAVPQKPVEPAGAAGPALAYVKDSARVLREDGTAGDAGSYEPSTKTVAWQVGDIPAGESRTVEFQVTVPWVASATVWENVGVARYSNNPHGPDAEVPSNAVKVNTDLGTGSLAVSKTVKGVDGSEPTDEQRTASFDFTVDLAHPRATLPAQVNVVYRSGDGSEYTEPVTLTKYSQFGGTVVLSLSHGQTATVAGLPDGTFYTVTEDDPKGFTANKDKDVGSVGLAGAEVGFVNTALPPDEPEPAFGKLSISKTVVGGAATDEDRSRAFEFTLRLHDAEGNALEGEFVATLGDGSEGRVSNGSTIVLAHGQTATVTGLPAGAVYAVTETPVDGFEMVAVGDTGNVVADATATASFVNVRKAVPPVPDPPVGDVMVSKLVDLTTAEAGDLERDFSFALELLDADGAPLAGKVAAELVDGDTVSAREVGHGDSFTLRHGQALLLHDLPYGTRYAVTEQPADGFTTREPTLKGEVTEDALATGSLAFVNHRVAPPSLKIEKSQALVTDGAVGTPTTGGLQVPEGATVEYRLTVTNTGEAAAEGVEVSDEVPATATKTTTDAAGNPVTQTEALALAYVDGSASDGGVFRAASDGAPAQVSWNLGSLAGGQSRTVSFRVSLPVPEQPTAPDQTAATWSWRNVAVARYANNPDNPDDPNEPPADIPSNPVDVEEGEPKPLVSIHKHQQVKGSDAGFSQEGADAPLATEPGDTVVYRLQVTNGGAGAAPDVVVADPLPAGLTYVEGSATGGGSYDAASGTLVWRLGKLAPYQTVELTFEVTVPQVSEATSWHNVATVDHATPDDPGTRVEVPPSEDVFVATNVPHVTLRKEQSLAGGAFTEGPQTGACGEVLTYRLAVTNDGAAVARGVTVSDVVPQAPVVPSGAAGPALAYVEGSAGMAGADGTASFDGGTATVAWQVGDLAPGQTVFVHFSVRLPEIAADSAATWKNVGVARFENDSAGPGTDIPSNEVEVTVERDPDPVVPPDEPDSALGSIAVSKTVEGGDEDDRRVAFTFDLVLEDAQGKPLTGSFAWERTDGASGTVASGGTLELAHGQIVVVSGLPEGAHWTVSEREVEGFSAKEPSLAGDVPANGVGTAAFVNVADEKPPVPDDPGEPDDPDDPPAPDDPVEPEQPDEPEDPATPARPGGSRLPDTGSRAPRGAAALVATGDPGTIATGLGVAAAAVAAVAGAVAFRRRR